MRYFKYMLVLVALVVFTGGCSSPKDANKENFQKVLNDYYDNNCVLLTLPKTNFPASVDNRNRELGTYMHFKANTGFLESHQGNVGMGTFTWIKVPGTIFSLTEKGTKAFGEANKKGFCTAIYRVDEINSFTEPTQFGGRTISRVEFTVSPHRHKEWVKKLNTSKYFPQLDRKLTKYHQSQKAVLVLMNDGWVHESEIR